MARILEDYQRNKILRIIDFWQGKLTWDLLCSKIKSDLEVSISRQSLSADSYLLRTYQKKKKELRKIKEVKPKSDSVLYNENLALKEKKVRLEKDVNHLIERYLTLLANVNGGAEIIQEDFFFKKY